MKAILKTFVLFTIFLNISNAQSPIQNAYLLRQLDNYGSSYAACWGYVAPDGREYALLGCVGGTSIVDITDTANIHEVDYVPNLNSSWHEMKTYSHYAYIVSEATNSALQIIDLQYLPDSARLVKTWNYAGYTKTHSIQQSGHYLYLNGGNAAPNGGISVVDVIDPENPVKKGQWTTEYVHDCRVLNDTIWASNVYSGRTSIISAVDKNNLQFIDNWQSYPSAVTSTHNSAITNDRKYILTTNELQSPVGKMSIFNIEDLDNITFVMNWQPTGITTSIVHNVEIYGDYAVIAHYTAGIRVVNISNPVSPVEVAWYDTYAPNNFNNFSGCWGVYKFPSGKIIGSDISGGLFVIKTTIYDLNHPPIKLDLKVSTEGLYNNLTDRLSRKDSVTVYLRNISSPYSIVDSAKAPIDTVSLKGSFKFSNTATGSYYVVVKHFNGLETWSKPGGEPLVAEGPVYDYDFTSSSSQAYGSNQQLKGSKYFMYSGDINKSNTIDLDDVLSVYNDAEDFSAGVRLISDLNGDGIADLSDLTLVFNNSNGFIAVSSPLSMKK